MQQFDNTANRQAHYETTGTLVSKDGIYVLLWSMAFVTLLHLPSIPTQVGCVFFVVGNVHGFLAKFICTLIAFYTLLYFKLFVLLLVDIL
jgi:hypothetical protein